MLRGYVAFRAFYLQIIIFRLISLSKQRQKMVKTGNHTFLEPKLMSAIVLLCLSSGPKTQLYSNLLNYKSMTGHNSCIWEAGTLIYSFILQYSKQLIDYQNSCQLIFCPSANGCSSNCSILLGCTDWNVMPFTLWLICLWNYLLWCRESLELNLNPAESLF